MRSWWLTGAATWLRLLIITALRWTSGKRYYVDISVIASLFSGAVRKNGGFLGMVPGQFCKFYVRCGMKHCDDSVMVMRPTDDFDRL